MPSFRPQLLRLAGFSLAGLVAFAGCSSSATTTIAVTHPTMIRVEPEDFLGTVPCDPNGSGLKRYVATIVDYDFGEGGAGGEPATLPEAQGFQAPSSLPTPCTTGVGFGFVVPGRHYEVLIDGYDRSDLVPRATGSREMLPADAAGADVPSDVAVHTNVVAPRWHAYCRRAIATDSTIVQAGDCEPFPPAGGTTGTVRVALGPLLGQLHCGSAPGEVDHFTVTATLPDGTTQDQDAACPVDSAAAPPVAVFSDLPARRLSFYVQAISADSDVSPIAGAECNAVVEADASRDAACAALSEVGTVQLDVAAALKQLGASCSAELVSSVTVTAVPVADNTPQSLPPPDCLQPFTHGFLPGPMPAGLVLTATLTGTGDQVSLSCHAEVEPGRVVAATCEP
ncbi:MAG TPA: hypothetical protein VHB79_18525 [Polyangiaceae bacterium]|nr:hypothetical protein [Polyangiaceae bacterium]